MQQEIRTYPLKFNEVNKISLTGGSYPVSVKARGKNVSLYVLYLEEVDDVEIKEWSFVLVETGRRISSDHRYIDTVELDTEALQWGDTHTFHVFEII